MIDGFSSVQAVKRSKRIDSTQKEAPVSPPKPKAKAPPATPEKPRERRIDHTTVPTRHEVVCYVCSYAFVLTGQMTKVFCPKCRTQLETGDLIIDNKRTEDIKTMGIVRITQDGSIENATVIATDIIVAGDVTKADLQPSRAIEIDTGAMLDHEALKECNLVIRKEARVTFGPVITCANIDIKGEINARILCTGKTTIHPGSFFRGELTSSHLEVADGARLKAKLAITPTPSPT